MNRLDRILQGFLEDLEVRRFSHRTLEYYRWSMGRFRRFLQEAGIERLDEITPRVLAEYQTKITLGPRETGRPYTASVLNHLLGNVRSFFRYLVRRGVLLVNPAESLILPRSPDPVPRQILTVVQMKRLLLSPDVTDPIELRDRALLEILYSSGIRVSELIGLDLADIDLEADELHVRRGKGGKSRSIPTGKAACQWVGRYLKESRPALTVKSSEKALFLSFRGRRMDRANVERIVRTHGKRAGIPFTVTPHLIRHTFATHLLKGKASLRHLQQMLGHQNLNSTQRYTRLDLTDLKETHRRCHPRGQVKKPTDP